MITWPSFSWFITPVSKPAFQESGLKACGLQSFECFKKSWEISDFWKRANTSDACLVMLDTLISKYPYDQLVSEACKEFVGILEKNLAYYNFEDKDNKWADDFGWWGLLGLNAHSFLTKMKKDSLAAKYLDVSNECYDLLKKATHDKGVPVMGGLCNSSFKNPETGVKNTVVNALFLLLSTKLYNFHKDHNLDGTEKFVESIDSQRTWFDQWFKPEYQYLKTFKGDSEAALVCERPLSSADDSTYKDKSNPTWSPGWVWTGDQGLLIGALILLEKHRPMEEVARKLIHGVQKGLIGKDGIFYEPPCPSSYTDHANDYFGGRGILVRNMELNKIKEIFRIDFKENIEKTLEAIWQTRDEKSNQFKIDFTNKMDHLAYSEQFNLLWETKHLVDTWNITDPAVTDAISQAVGFDFIAAALKMS